MKTQPPLKRSLSLVLTTFYGLGTILGAGIYVLVGKVAGYAGLYTPVAFLLAALIATLTGLSYTELASRYPVSAGEAAYVRHGLGWNGKITGWLVVITGVVSAATLSRGFVGYFHIFFPLQDWIIILALVLLLGGVAAIGITESVVSALVITLIEIGGLCFVLFVGRESFVHLPENWASLFPPPSGEIWMGVTLGAFLAFYAFIGFEDIVNIAEEVKEPRKNVPLAILFALGGATIFYLLISLAAVLSLPLEELAHSATPLALVIESHGFSPHLISLISLIAVINGALVQIIMAARVVYGMAKQKSAPEIFCYVGRRTQTPLLATALITAFVLLLALFFPLVGLAEVTSWVILLVFALVNASLVSLKVRKVPSRGKVSTPLAIPLLGGVLCIALLLFKSWKMI